MPIQVPWASTPSRTPSNSQCGSSGHLRHSTLAGRSGAGMRRGYVGPWRSRRTTQRGRGRRDHRSLGPSHAGPRRRGARRRPVTLKLELLQHAGSFKVARRLHQRALRRRAAGDAWWRPPAATTASPSPTSAACSGIPARIFVPAIGAGTQGRCDRRLGAEVNGVGATYAEALVASREAGRGARGARPACVRRPGDRRGSGHRRPRDRRAGARRATPCWSRSAVVDSWPA